MSGAGARAAWLLAALFAGCNRPKGVHPDPATATAKCRQALAEAQRFGANGRIRHSLSGCKDLYSERDCRDAVQDYADWQADHQEKQMVERCVAAYCPRLPEPRPALCTGAETTAAEWGTFNEKVMRYELGADISDAAKVLDTVLTPGRAALKPFAPVAARPVPPLLEVRVAVSGESTHVRLLRPDGGVSEWDTPWQPEVGELESIRDALAAERSASVRIRSEKKVMFLMIRGLMMSSVDAGSEDILFGTLD